MTKRVRYTEEEEKEIIKLKYTDGLSSRKIAKKLDRSKSGINDFLERERQKGNLLKYETKLDKHRVLLLDLETAPSIAAVFGRFNQNISHEAVIQEGGWMLSWAAQWLDEDTVQASVLAPNEAKEQNDIRLCLELLKLLEEATEVVMHNGKSFDIPVLKTRLILNNLPPMKKVRIIDTFLLAKEFRFNRNKLDALCKQLELDRKVSHDGISLWVDCMNGDSLALGKMLEYNIGDIPTLKQLYLAIRSHSTRHPNLNVYYGDTQRCNICLSSEVEETGNSVASNLSTFPEYKCNSCGARFRGRKSTTTKEQRSNFLSN